jgi:hypothetical protein
MPIGRRGMVSATLMVNPQLTNQDDQVIRQETVVFLGQNDWSVRARNEKASG